MAQRPVPAPFLTKTYHLVDDRSSDDVISWNEAGTTFVVWKTAEFAKDLLPKYFKHNNFSSFVRQLNTYGFRKTAPDKWEFANENFKRGEKDLLSQIRRRKTASIGAKPVATDKYLTSPSSSSDGPVSSSTSSPDSKNPGSMETHVSAQLAADLSGENEKLRKDNQVLSSELAQTKKQCDELVAFLTRCMKVAPEQISRIMGCGAEAAAGSSGGVVGGEVCDSDDDDDEKDECMKLFGVVLKKKRGCSENSDFPGPPKKEMKRGMEVDVPWISAETSKVCN